MHAESTPCAVRRMVRLGHVVAALAIGVSAFATTADAQNRAVVKIDFAFVAAGKEMPAAAYELETAAQAGTVILRTQSLKPTVVVMPVITRLGRHDNDAEPELVFDKVEGKFILSEVWFPTQDGYLLTNTPAEHEHRVLGGSRPHK